MNIFAKAIRINAIYYLTVLTVFSSCLGDPAEMYSSMPKIDAHVHIRTGDPAIMEFALTEGFKFLTINTRSESQDHIDMQMGFARDMAARYPDRISYISTFSMENFQVPGWTAHVISGLQREFDEGAVGVKVWKDIGMTFRDSLGNFVFIDDPMFEPILEFIARSGKPLIAHIGEPKNCWLPIDSMTVNNDKGYFKNNPQYHMYLHPEFPSHKRLVDSRDNVLAAHPDLKLIGAHLGSLEWDVDELAERLDKYPNFAVDMAARVCHFQVQDREKVRDFIITYQDRLLYATDLIVSENDDFEARRKGLQKSWRSDWDYFATDKIMNSRNVEGEFKALDLDKSILRKIYYTNAIHWYPGLFNQ